MSSMHHSSAFKAAPLQVGAAVSLACQLSGLAMSGLSSCLPADRNVLGKLLEHGSDVLIELGAG